MLHAQPKPEKRSVIKKAKQAQDRRRRRLLVAYVWLRDGSACVRCGIQCVEPKDTYETDPLRGEVNDIVPRSKGGDPYDATNNELLCRECHYGGPSGAHAPTPDRMDRRKDHA